MFRYLKQANYTVLWYGKNDMLSADSFSSSVTDWKEEIGVAMGGNAFKFGEAGYYSFLNEPAAVLGNSTKNGDFAAVQLALDFIKSDPPEPFMIFLPGKGSHPPYGAPKDYFDMYTAEQVQVKAPLRPSNLPNKPKYHTGIIKYRTLTSFNESFFEKINAIYLGRVSYVDWIFGQLIDGLDSSSVGKNTAVFMSSDHGDFAGDFHLVEKWPGGMDDILTRVPMIVRIPGGKKGHVVQEPINSFDMMATILEMAKVNVTHVHFAQSFIQQLYGANGDPNRTVYSEGGFQYHNEIEPYDPKQKGYWNKESLYYPRGQEEIHEGIPRVVMARTMEYKLVYRPLGVSEFYDLKGDPRELSNVYMDDKYLSIRKAMESELLSWMVKTGDVTPLAEDNRGLPPSPSA
jgi:choline-sulfatase